MRILPPWDNSMSDGCSVPSPLRPFLLRSPQAQAACRQHDEAYYYGGSWKDRLRADLRFALALLDTPDAEQAELAFSAVRVGGGPEWRRPGISWAFGGEYFKYDDAPARLEV